MNIIHIISYKGGYENPIFKEVTSEVETIIKRVDQELQKKCREFSEDEDFLFFKDSIEQGIWSTEFIKQDWIEESYDYTSQVYFLKNNAKVNVETSNSLLPWLFIQSKKDYENDITNLPIAIVKNNRLDTYNLEPLFKELTELQPLNVEFSFVVFFVSELQVDKNIPITSIKETATNIIVDKNIEFPPEHYHAGLGILNYFNTYVNKKYINQSVSVKIEQNGNLIKLVIDLENGSQEIIEEALEEYHLIITGQNQPEEFTDDKELILELKNELRIAQMRIDSKNDIIGYLEKDKLTLSELLETALAQEKKLTFELNSTISNAITIENKNYIPNFLPIVHELKDVISHDDDSLVVVEGIENALKDIESEQDPEVVKNSKAMQRIKSAIEKVNKGNDKFANAVKQSEKAIDSFQKLAGQYNKIAQWCGLPVVPEIFTK